MQWGIYRVDKVIKEYADNFIAPLFLHRFEKNTRVTLQNLFVEPSLSQIKVLDSGTGSYNNIVELLDFFIWDRPKDRLLFIDGDAAIGKTSLISWLCYHYHKLDDIGKSIFLNTKFVCVRLRDLSFTKNCSAEECILKYLSFEDMDAFERQYGNALMVLEGADELGIINGIESSAIERFIHNVRHAFDSHKIVITSRPKFINMREFSGITQGFSYQHYSLDHFSAEKRDAWLDNYESPQKCGKMVPVNTKHYLSKLTDNEASGVADTPLALYLLVGCDMTEPLRNNKWALYHEIFHKAIRNTPYNEAFQDKGVPRLHKALQEDQFAEDVYCTIGEIANKMFKNFREERFYISSSELNAIITNGYHADKSEYGNAIRKCCVLCAYWKENSNIGALEFYHNDIRAFFMCEYIYHKFSNIKLFPVAKDSFRQFIRCGCETFQYGSIARTTWVQTFSFLYYRLQCEKDNPPSDTYCPSFSEVERLFHSIMYATVNEIVWKYSFDGLPYESIKTTFFNFVLFLRIWLSPFSATPMTTFLSKDGELFWHNTELFRDWCELFSDSVELSNGRHISFGSQMKYDNMTFDGENLMNACFETSTFFRQHLG